MIRTVQSSDGDLSEYLKRYEYQPKLTARLDKLFDAPFSQATVNEIVLWKINRYAEIPRDMLDSLYALRLLAPTQHPKAKQVLENLLDCDGVDLPMASTLLRFQNPDVFQIIDRHAYRAAFAQAYQLYSATPAGTKVSTYFAYLDKLHSLAASSGAAFRELDRILYMFDKKHNGGLSDKAG